MSYEPKTEFAGGVSPFPPPPPPPEPLRDMATYRREMRENGARYAPILAVLRLSDSVFLRDIVACVGRPTRIVATALTCMHRSGLVTRTGYRGAWKYKIADEYRTPPGAENDHS